MMSSSGADSSADTKMPCMLQGWGPGWPAGLLGPAAPDPRSLTPGVPSTGSLPPPQAASRKFTAEPRQTARVAPT